MLMVLILSCMVGGDVIRLIMLSLLTAQPVQIKAVQTEQIKY